MKLKSKSNTYEITVSKKSDPHNWTSFEVEHEMLLLKLSEVLSNNTIQLECVALVKSPHPNRYDLPKI